MEDIIELMRAEIASGKEFNVLMVETADEIRSLREEVARLRLTDEERAAIEFKAAYCVTVADQMHQRCAATLRGLLERTK
jgi:hypothetical protein